MNCGYEWSYAFLSSQMTKNFLQNDYKNHIKEGLLREVESGLGEYQDLAVLTDRRDIVRSQLHKVEDDLYALEDNVRDYMNFKIVFEGRCYDLYMVMRSSVPQNRVGAKIISHVQKLVNPPQTEKDKEDKEAELVRLEKKWRQVRLLHMYSVLDLYTFYTDKTLIAWTAYISTVDLSANEKVECMETMRKLKTEHERLYACMKESDNNYVETGTNETILELMKEYRQITRQFWKQYFKAHPPTSQDFQTIQDDKKKYSKLISEYKHQIQQIEWDREDIHDYFKCNTSYAYNLDDCVLYPIKNSSSFEDCAHNNATVSTILDMEEANWKNLMKESAEQLTQLTPLFRDLLNEYRQLGRDIRMKNKQKTIHGTYVMNCPIDACTGKLDENNQCGMCHSEFCVDCMKKITELDGMMHTCQKEDVATVKELRKNTHPCPKCHVPIYKTEGCDQMWCIQCHTTFSWKSGAITYGVIHNPHFYEYNRDNLRRAPGDIPCGGLPNDAEMFSAFVTTNNTIMFDIWDYCVWIAEKHMPSIYRRFNNVRDAVIRRHSIAYLRKKIDKKRLGVLLYKHYMDNIRYAHYYDILETLTDNMADQLRQYVRGIDTTGECVALLRIAEQDIAHMNKMFGMREKFHGSRFIV